MKFWIPGVDKTFLIKQTVEVFRIFVFLKDCFKSIPGRIRPALALLISSKFTKVLQVKLHYHVEIKAKETFTPQPEKTS